MVSRSPWYAVYEMLTWAPTAGYLGSPSVYVARRSVLLQRRYPRVDVGGTPRPYSRADRCTPWREAASFRWLSPGAGAGQPPAREALR